MDITTIDTLRQTLEDRIARLNQLAGAEKALRPALAHVEAERTKLFQAGPDAPVPPEEVLCLLSRHQCTIMAGLDLGEALLLASETLADMRQICEVVTAKCGELADALEAERVDNAELRGWTRELEKNIAGKDIRGWN